MVRPRLFRYAWAAPTTAVGLLALGLALASGGRARVREGAVEVRGGFATWFARRVGFAAMTLGHVILGRDEWSLDACRAHEQVHVRQAERWGIAFIPAYLAASLLAWRAGGHYYFDNWFERDARARCGQEPSPVPDLNDDERSRLAHPERHLRAGDAIRDVVIGMADGLTVPFALAAGLAEVAAGNGLIVTAGLAEIAAGAIAMGLGGFLAARSDAEYYDRERRREEQEVDLVPDLEEAETVAIFEAYGLNRFQVEPILDAFRDDPGAWVDFMMRFELGLERPNPNRAFTSAATIGGSYVVGGMVPLAPYMLMAETRPALWTSATVTLLTLLVFGYVKGRFTGVRPFRSAFQTAAIGGAAAAAAFAIARCFA